MITNIYKTIRLRLLRRSNLAYQPLALQKMIALSEMNAFNITLNLFSEVREETINVMSIFDTAKIIVLGVRLSWNSFRATGKANIIRFWAVRSVLYCVHDI